MTMPPFSYSVYELDREKCTAIGMVVSRNIRICHYHAPRDDNACKMLKKKGALNMMFNSFPNNVPRL